MIKRAKAKGTNKKIEDDHGMTEKDKYLRCEILISFLIWTMNLEIKLIEYEEYEQEWRRKKPQ